MVCLDIGDYDLVSITDMVEYEVTHPSTDYGELTHIVKDLNVVVLVEGRVYNFPVGHGLLELVLVPVHTGI